MRANPNHKQLPLQLPELRNLGTVLRILLAPVLAPTWLVVALLTPYRSARLTLFAATVVELAVIGFAGLTWVLSPDFHERS